MLRSTGQWYATSISVGKTPSPTGADAGAVRDTGHPALLLSGTPQLVVGVPLPAVHAAYYEVFSLDELEGTLRTLAFALAAAALVTTPAGALLGRWASGRALRPLDEVTDAAVAIAGGQLTSGWRPATTSTSGAGLGLQPDDRQPAGPDRAGGPVHL